MKYKIILFLFVIIFSGCKKELNEDDLIIKIAEKTHKRDYFIIQNKLEGNFTNSGKRELLVNFETVDKECKESVYVQSMVFVFDDENNIENCYDLYFKNFGSEHGYIKEKDLFTIKFQNSVLYDFNQNRKIEFFYFIWEGSCATFYIEEFKDGKFQHICQTYNGDLNIPGLYNFDLTHFDFETKSLYLSDRESPEKIKLTWNPETEFYEKEILQK